MPDSPSSPFQLGVVLLGAGFSSRMGSPKLLLPWGPTTIIGQTLATWNQVRPAQIVVVCRPEDRELTAELDRLGLSDTDRVFNPLPEQGMFSSIQAAARWARWMPTLTHWAIALGDQPHLSSGVLRALIAFAMERPERICQPSHRERGRHPVILPRRQFCALASAKDAHLKAFLKRTAEDVARCEIDDPGLDLDLDTRAEYEAALTRFAAQSDLPGSSS